MATRDDVFKVCQVMAAAYPNFVLRKDTIDIYSDLLADIETGVLGVAARQAIAESKFFPTVAELRERVVAMHKSASRVPDAEAAWREVLGAFAHTSCIEAQPKFSHPVIDEAVRRIGWRDIGMCDSDNLRTLFAQFRNTYNTLIERATTEIRTLPKTQAVIDEIARRMDMNRMLLSPGKDGAQ